MRRCVESGDMAKRYRRALCWIRRDLRLYDHRPLSEACSEADEVAIVFVFDTTILNALEDLDDRRVTFMHRSVKELDLNLRSDWGSTLVVLKGNPVDEIPALAAKLGVEAVFAGRDWEPMARRRDDEVASRLESQGVALNLIKDQVIFECGDIETQKGAGFRVYTPYARAWRSKFHLSTDATDDAPNLSVLMDAASVSEHCHPWTYEDLGFQEASLDVEAGEAAGRKALDAFAQRMSDYAKCRDFPAIDGTSRLSVHLRFGTVSIRDCVRRAVELKEAGDKWLSELIWREFYQEILARYPHVVDEPFQSQYRELQYPGLEEHWEAWCEGRTGYPIVDAAMRCFTSTGWMHNRLRMIVASFLTKDLLIDYRRGEAFFARYLIDYDLASNNGGWQWTAGTGVDAQPYFRVFNPILQSRKFDPQGIFIRRWIPELSHLDSEKIHWPHDAKGSLFTANGGYPEPIVDHAIQRDRAVSLYAEIAKSNQSPEPLEIPDC